MTTILFRRGSAAQWTSANPILGAGEPGFETDTDRHKIGDGVTNWSSLPYFVSQTELNATYVTLVPNAFANQVIPGGIELKSSTYTGDDHDGTSRLTLESWQRPQTGPWGEAIRFMNRQPQSKTMLAWYSTRNTALPYDPTTNPMQLVTWAGAHAASQDGTLGVDATWHVHWSVEVPTLEAGHPLRSRFAVTWGNETDGTIGVDIADIYTNRANLYMQADQAGSGILRMVGAATIEKRIEFGTRVSGSAAATRHATTGLRWALRELNETESGSNAGSGFEFAAYDDAGAKIAPVYNVLRADGTITFGGTSHFPAQVTSRPASGTLISSFLSAPTALASGFSAYRAIDPGTDGTAILLDGRRGSETISRFSMDHNGLMSWGTGTASRDVNLYRYLANRLRTDYSLDIVQNLRIGSAAVASNGVGIIAIATAATIPTGTPTGGGFLYVDAGALKYKGSSGTVTAIAAA